MRVCVEAEESGAESAGPRCLAVKRERPKSKDRPPEFSPKPGSSKITPPATLEHYRAAMLLSGVGDAIGYRSGSWEFNQSGPAIQRELKELGGLKKIKVELPDWPVSDDTVLHLATAEGLATGKTGEELLHDVAARYVEAMKDMDERAPGNATILGVSQLRPGEEGGYRVAYNPRGTGCGAAMRSMCIGLRYPKPDQLDTLVSVAVETGRMTHPHPTAKSFVKERGHAVEETERDWDFFCDKWQWYLDLRGISNGVGPVVWPSSYGPAERDKVYNSFNPWGWGGSSGHDAPMIALDALLAAGSDWEELMSRAAFHGGDNDSTAVIACCCWGLLYGTQGVPKGNYSHLEYRDRLKKSAELLYALSHREAAVLTTSFAGVESWEADGGGRNTEELRRKEIINQSHIIIV
ncbi:hypothetical protein Q5P01_024398 [Channa striata]|uniref:ADP-ribosylarginine hydrolase n=1 Tax=Channa striata TaxID=64152 RepID=A0AA88IQV8_CHASR|nr:hypothetical protein Q5P01_024398 [Channa striata]